MWWDADCLVRLALIYRGQVVPKLWTVLEHPSSSVAYEVYERALDKVAELLPARYMVVLTADRGFADTHLMKHLIGLVGIGACVSKGVLGSTAMGCIPAKSIGWLCLQARRSSGILSPSSSWGVGLSIWPSVGRELITFQVLIDPERPLPKDVQPVHRSTA
jgi:hypothetical protein